MSVPLWAFVASLAVTAAVSCCAAYRFARRDKRSDRRRYRALLAGTQDAVLETDEHGRVQLLNAEAERLTGWGAAAAAGRHWREVAPLADATDGRPVPGPVDRALHAGESADWADGTVLTGRDGTRWQIEHSAALVRDRSGRATGTVMMFREIDSRRRAERDRATLRAMLENGVDFIGLAGADGRIRYINPAARRLCGIGADVDAAALHLDDFFTADDLPFVRETIVPTALACGSWSGEFRFRDFATGKALPFAYTLFRVDDPEGGGVLGLATISRPIGAELAARAERQAALARERKLRAAADRANRTKSQFLANMSHEIRTPMTAVLGYADILGDSLADPENRRHLNVIKRHGTFLLDLINDILDISRIEAGKIELNPTDFDPRDMIEDVFSLMAVRAKEAETPLKLRYHSPFPVKVRTDRTRLRQVLINLISNAIKFGGGNEVTVVVTAVCEPDGGDTGTLSFAVCDRGAGIDPIRQQEIFKPFVQGDNSHARQFGGTGLGLAISRSLCRLLGGDLKLTSVPGVGSTFTATVAAGPLRSVEWIDLDDPHLGTLRPRLAALEHDSPHADGKLDCHVLVVDDRRDVRFIAERLLAKAGARVTAVENGQQAVERLAMDGHDVGAVLLDMQMPVMDGYETARQLRAAGFARPIVALTANAMAGDRDQCLAAGCDGYLSKPLDHDSLLATINELLDRDR